MKIVASKEVYRSKVFHVTEDRAVDPKTGWTLDRSVVRHAGSAVILAVDEKKRVLLVRQYRLPAGGNLWELPAGRIDPGETPLRAAKRELAEETGFRAAIWTKLASFWPSPGFLQERMTIYLASGLAAGAAAPMEDERIESRWFPKRDLADMIRAGKIEDGKTLIGFHSWTRL